MDARAQRRQLRSLRRESVWLQKAVFALAKAEEEHLKAAEVGGQSSPLPLALPVNKKSTPVEKLKEALNTRVEELQASLREVQNGVSGFPR
ncbi:MAG: hypothetical protein ACREKN_03725 [Longimicrobiaceae bacterium]